MKGFGSKYRFLFLLGNNLLLFLIASSGIERLKILRLLRTRKNHNRSPEWSGRADRKLQHPNFFRHPKIFPFFIAPPIKFRNCAMTTSVSVIFLNFPVVPVVNLCNRPDPAENTNVKDPPVSITIGGAASPRLFARSGGTPIGNIAAQNQNQWDSNSLRVNFVAGERTNRSPHLRSVVQSVVLRMPKTCKVAALSWTVTF